MSEVCKGCKAPIAWVRLAGRWHPANPKTFTIIVDGKLVTGPESHFSTCPHAGEFRSRTRTSKE